MARSSKQWRMCVSIKSGTDCKSFLFSSFLFASFYLQGNLWRTLSHSHVLPQKLCCNKFFHHMEWNLFAILWHRVASHPHCHHFVHMDTHFLYFYCLDFHCCCFYLLRWLCFAIWIHTLTVCSFVIETIPWQIIQGCDFLFKIYLTTKSLIFKHCYLCAVYFLCPFARGEWGVIICSVK